MTEISEDTRELLEKSINDELENYDVTVHEGNKKGDGFLSDMIFISLKNKKTRKDFHLVIKQALPSSSDDNTRMISELYLREIEFYTQVIPAMLGLQKLFKVKEIFNSSARCYAFVSEATQEKLVLDNLKFNNYKIHPKTEPLDIKTCELVFKVYGKFHGVSRALKHHQPEKFLEVTASLECLWTKLIPQISKLMRPELEMLREELVENGENEILGKYQKYINKTEELFTASTTYNGSYPVLTHGDCWSNNLMFKYNSSGEPEDVKLIDYQLSNIGCAVLDLSYFLYSGAGKETLDNFEHLLKIYHKSLSETLMEFNCDPEQMYPYETLKKEWKEYCVFGYLMGIHLWFIKTTDLSNIDFDSLMSREPITKTNNEVFRGMTFNLTKHMFENDFL